MRIGMIIGNSLNKQSFRSGYYLSGMILSERVSEIFSTAPIKDTYGWFAADNPKVTILPKEQIEAMADLDFVLYGWHRLLEPSTRLLSKCRKVIFDCGDGCHLHTGLNWAGFLKEADFIFKLSCPRDKKFLRVINDPSKKWKETEKWLMDKVYPLIFTGAGPVPYLNFPYEEKYKISFNGSITSKERLDAVKRLKEKYGNDFYGGFCRDTRSKSAAFYDEQGSNILGLDISEYRTKHWSNKEFLSNMNKSIVSLCPPGFGINTHRFIDVLSMGGCALVYDLSKLDFGPLAPPESSYMEYKGANIDLLDKVDFLLKNPAIVSEIRTNARSWAEHIYFNRAKVVEEYIFKIIDR